MKWDTVHDSRAAFLACMQAFCAPGTPIESPAVQGLSDHPELARAGAVLLALLDRGLTLGAGGGEAALRLAGIVSESTGADPAGADIADWVLVHGPAATAITQARRGTRRTPETGATVVVATSAEARPITLSGPGLRQRTTVYLPLDALALHAFAAANAAQPTGVDVLIATPECLIGMPRSVTVHGVG
ncbi:phosphonate C-P lyase system protein PhnH [Mycobacterium sp. AMU20-3851]|uniref:phosphonate C-P lyase system protein PhnH n=1 Tax=Mycobacterium sp. AMU20-3851 TaxID=3122055 RepID=UPI003754EF37